MQQLQEYLRQFIPKDDLFPIINLFSNAKEYKKNQLLVEPGMTTTFLAFIKKGGFRIYFYNEKGVQITVWFVFQGKVVTDLYSYYQETKASYYVEAIDDSEVYIVKKNDLETLYLQEPKFIEFGRKFAENAMVDLMERMVSMQTMSAEERYKELLAQPHFMQNIPLKHLATFLGITDTSLSRIRKK